MVAFDTHLNSFLPLPETDLRTLLHLFKPRSLKKNEFYIKAGEQATTLCFLEEGIMRTFYNTTEGNEYNKVFFTNPSIVGSYSSLITKTSSHINIQCLSECKVLEASFQSILDLYAKHPLIERLNRVIAEDFFVRNEQREFELMTTDASFRYKQFQSLHPGLENEITQYHIASYLGITPTQLSRIRAQKA